MTVQRCRWICLPVSVGSASDGIATDFSAACFAVYTKKPAIPAGFCCLLRCWFFTVFREFFVFPGDGCRRESGSVFAPLHPPEKNALGEGVGAWGEGNTLCASQGVPFPPTLPHFHKKGGPEERVFLPGLVSVRRGKGGNPPEGTILEHFQFETL